MSLHPKQQEFISALERALTADDFVKLSLGAYRGGEEGLKNITVKKVVIKREDKLSFTYRYQTRDIVKNFSYGEAIEKIEDALLNGFQVATLFTTKNDLAYDGQRDKHNLKTTAATHQAQPSTDHDRNKQRLLEASVEKTYLHHLKITDASGQVLKTAQDKYRQINKYIEVLSGLIKALPETDLIQVADMGSGKGYLTFALYDYLTNVLDRDAQVTGVEYRPDMVALCNDIAGASRFRNLKFVEGSIEHFDAAGTNILIALHACDTATDDAIAKGVQAGSDLIVVAPCCHKQIRRAMEQGRADNDLGFLLQHGIFMERQAEMVTDGLRALLLEYEGYSTKVFEFISDAHTPKNVMIIGTRNPKLKKHDPAVLARIQAAKAYFGIDQHHLETRLEKGRGL